MILFSKLIEEIRFNIMSNKQSLTSLANKNPNIAYQKLNELVAFTGLRHKLDLKLHFPIPDRIRNVDEYGTENIGIVFDKFRKLFPIPRETIKEKVLEIMPDAIVKDAYMYEGKEGLKATIKDGRLEILPGSIHIWTKVDKQVIVLLDWLMENVYQTSKDLK